MSLITVRGHVSHFTQSATPMITPPPESSDYPCIYTYYSTQTISQISSHLTFHASLVICLNPFFRQIVPHKYRQKIFCKILETVPTEGCAGVAGLASLAGRASNGLTNPLAPDLSAVSVLNLTKSNEI